MKNLDNQKLLNDIYKNVRMATWAIDNISSAIENEGLLSLVRKQNAIYEDITHQCENIAKKNNAVLNDLSSMLKGMSWMGIKMGTLFNKKTYHLAEKLIQGTTMGITDILKSIAKNKSSNQEIKTLANSLREKEEFFVESLKEFLIK